MYLRSIVVTLFLLSIPASVVAVEAKNPCDLTLTLCRIEFTDLGKTSSFHFNYIYILNTDEKGCVERIAVVREPDHEDLVRVDLLKECMTRWTLAPSSKYTVIFSLGTTSESNFVSVTDASGCRVKLIIR
jgi:hypothetical protein